MYLNLVPAILTARLEACKTNEAHSFHVRQYLASHNLLNSYIDLLTTSQLLFFYRNIAYIERNAGKQYVFDWLVYNIMTVRNLPIAEYVMKHDLTNQPTNIYPNLVFYRNPINSEFNFGLQSNLTLQEVLINERPLAFSNEAYEEDYTPLIQESMENSRSNVLKTKVLESSVIDETNSAPYSLSDILLNHWIWLAANGNYTAYVDIINPKNGETLALTAQSAFILAFYCFCNSVDINPVTIPPMFAVRVQRIVTGGTSSIVSVSEIMSVVDTSIVSTATAVTALSLQPEIGHIISTSAFYDLCKKIYIAAQMQRNLIATQQSSLQRAMTFGMVSRIYSDNVCTFRDNGQNYANWLSINNIDLSGLSKAELGILYLNIVSQATGANLHTTTTIAEIQSAMIGLMSQLSSYSIQFVTSINSAADTKTDWTAVRISTDGCSESSYTYITDLGVDVKHVGNTTTEIVSYPMDSGNLLANVKNSQSISVKIPVDQLMTFTPPILQEPIKADMGAIRVMSVVFTNPSPSNPGIALFATGVDGNNNLSTGITSKYFFINDTTVAGTTLSIPRTTAAAVGNADIGLVAGGISGATYLNSIEQYNYSNDTTVISGVVLSLARFYLAGIGNKDVGIIAGGVDNVNGICDVVDRYTYATGTCVSGNKLGLGSSQLASIGNTTLGIIAGGNINTSGKNTVVTNYTNKYTYATDTTIPGITLAMARASMAGASTNTTGIFVGGYGDTQNGVNYFPLDYVEKYDYLTDTTVSGTKLGIARYGLAATSNDAMAIIGGGTGNNGVLHSTERYYYNVDVTIPGTSLAIPCWGLTAMSSTNMGGL